MVITLGKGAFEKSYGAYVMISTTKGQRAWRFALNSSPCVYSPCFSWRISSLSDAMDRICCCCWPCFSARLLCNAFAWRGASWMKVNRWDNDQLSRSSRVIMVSLGYWICNGWPLEIDFLDFPCVEVSCCEGSTVSVLIWVGLDCGGGRHIWLEVSGEVCMIFVPKVSKLLVLLVTVSSIDYSSKYNKSVVTNSSFEGWNGSASFVLTVKGWITESTSISISIINRVPDGGIS